MLSLVNAIIYHVSSLYYKYILFFKIFNDLKTSNPECLKKIKIVEGDLMKPCLGLNEEDKEILKDEVNMILHSAATVRFDEPLKRAVRVNLTSLRELLDIALQTKNLKVIKEHICNYLQEYSYS